MIEETITLVPGAVFRKVKELMKYNLYKAALELIEQNKIECKVYTQNVVKERQLDSRIDREISKNNR